MSDNRFTRFPLKKGEVISIANPIGSVIKADSGQLWITQSHQHEDIFIEAGGSFTPQQDGLIVVQAMNFALMSLTRKMPAAAPTQSKRDSLLNPMLQGA